MNMNKGTEKMGDPRGTTGAVGCHGEVARVVAQIGYTSLQTICTVQCVNPGNSDKPKTLGHNVLTASWLNTVRTLLLLDSTDNDDNNVDAPDKIDNSQSDHSLLIVK